MKRLLAYLAAYFAGGLAFTLGRFLLGPPPIQSHDPLAVGTRAMGILLSWPFVALADLLMLTCYALGRLVLMIAGMPS